MSLKNRDNHNRWRNKTVAFRVSPEEDRQIETFAVQYPKECRLIDNDEQGCKTFEVKKGRFGFKLTPPYTEERRKAASELAKKNGLKGRV